MAQPLDSELSDPVNSMCPPRWYAPGSFPSTSFPARQLIDALGNSPIGIAIVDRQLRIAAVNHKLAEINHIPPEAHPGRLVREIVGCLASTIETRLEGVFRTKTPLHNAELIGKLGANPELGHWLENYFPILDDFGQVVQVGVFLTSLLGARSSSVSDRASPGSNVLIGSHSSLPVRAADSFVIPESHVASDRDRGQLKRLTGRETDVLRLLAIGASSKEVSVQLTISVKTVDTYRARLMLKLHASSVAHLVHYAIRNRFVDLQASP